MGNKLPKNILRMKGLTMKQKWAMHKRGTKVKSRSGSGKVKSAKKWVKKQWGLGRIIASVRFGDVISRPAQWAHNHGTPGKFLDSIKYAYGAGLLTEGAEYDKSVAKSVYGEIGTGLAMTTIKSKAGVYKGAGKGKIISVVQAVLPEILAASRADPTKDIVAFNDFRRAYDSGGSSNLRGWNLDYNTAAGKMFWQEKGLSLALGIIQKVVFNTNGMMKLNRLLPKNVNG